LLKVVPGPTVSGFSMEIEFSGHTSRTAPFIGTEAPVTELLAAETVIGTEKRFAALSAVTT
jgi:hypothetical protein